MTERKAAPFSAVLIGDESLTIACGDMLIAGGHRIAGVVTRDEAVADWAAGQGARVLDAPADLLAADLQHDWLLSIANLRMIPDAVLALAAKGAVNFHDGPLPRYAGLNTPAWAIINGETSHGVSWHQITTGVDQGDLIAQKRVDIAADDTAFTLNAKCYAAGLESFAAVQAQLETGAISGTPQDFAQRSYFARDARPAFGGILDFTQPAKVLSALVRGLDFGGYWNPLATAKVYANGHIHPVKSLTIADLQGAAPGTVLEADGDALTIATADAPMRLLLGARHDLKVGDVIETPEVAEVAAGEEPLWRAELGGRPLTLPLVQTGLTVRVESLPLEAAGTSPEDQALAALIVARHSAGAEAGDTVAVAKPDDNPLAAGWVPLRVVEGELAEMRADVTAALRLIAQSSGMAADLPARAPEAFDGLPDIALSSGGPLPGMALTVELSETEPKLSFDPARVSLAGARLMQARLCAAFARIATAQTCDEVQAMPATEERLLEDWNATDRLYDNTTVHAAFEAQAKATPDATALVFEAESLTYAQLNARANRLAHALRGEGVTPGTPVGLYTRRSTDLLVGALGILKAGGAYVPLDPGYPADRIAHYITDSAAPVIVTQAALASQLPESTADILALDTDPALSNAPETNPAPAATPDDLAYLIYTSGSTGTPKGVMVSHANVANFFAGMDDRIDHAAGAVWLAVTSLSFDISVLELFWTLARGFKVVLAGDESRTMISNGPVTGSNKAIDFNIFYWGNDDGVGPKKYELLLEGAKFADAHGFNAVWTPERHFHAFGGPYPNPSVTGAAVASVTRNLAIRAGSCVAPLHHPARIAEEWAVIDNLTNGRVGLAIASGWQPDDFVLRPENTPPDNKAAMFTAIDQLRKLWAGEPVEFPKKDGTPHAVVTQPRPVSKKLPIWVTTAGNPQTWKEAGATGANVLTHLLGQSVAEVADKIGIYHAALREAGHDPADFTVTVMLHTFLADTREAAEEIAREPMKDYLRSAAGLIKQYAWAFPAFKRPEGATNPFEIDLEGLNEEEMDAILEFAFQRYFNDSGMFGTVEDGLKRTEELKAIGVTEVACLIDYGIDPAVVLEGLKPLAEVLRRANEEVTLEEDDFSLAAQLVRHDVSHLQCTPSMAQMLVMNEEARGALSGLQHIMVGGEALPGALAEALQQASPASLQNMYGPTETTIWSTTHMLARGQGGTAAPIGTAIANTQLYLLGEDMARVPVGVEGRLWIGGEGVTQGYWQREELTAERFIANPFGPGRIYDTGDLARLDADGLLHFAGRADAQVKIRGHRIELGEIEAQLVALPGVTQAVVIARDAPGGAQLVGYVTADQPLDIDAAKAKLADHLPAIMVPATLMTLEAMPLTPNKKIDRKALPAPDVQKATRPKLTRPTPTAYGPVAAAAATPETQAAIAAVWSGILGVESPRAEDNFFALGGHSLLAVQAHRDIKAALGADKLSITDIFRFPVLSALAAHIDAGLGRTAARKEAAPRRETQRTPVPALARPELAPETAALVSRRRDMRAKRSASWR
ncbi:MAG: MupA/Atu3671 family FMN-dependent luciferase-like monooxygenase [Pseudomonadota bacterium]